MAPLLNLSRTKKRSATIASTAAHPKLTEATDTSEQTVLEADTGLAPKQAKSTKRSPKSRQSRLTTASSKKIDTTLSDAETVEQGPEVNGPSEVNADDSAEPVIPTKSKRRTTRNAGIVSKTTARAKGTKTLSAAKSKKSQPSEQEYAQPSDMEMQTEAAVDLSEAESVGMSRRDAKLVTSSKIESQPGNKKIRTRSTRVRSSQMDQMPPQTGKLAQAQQDPARSESYNEVLTSRAELHPADPADTPKDAMPPALNDCTSSQPSTSTPDAVADTESIPRSDLKANINKQASGPGETRTLRKPPARSKPSSSQPSEQITSESEIEDEPDVRKSDITSVIIPMATSDEGSQEAATPKAASNSSKTHERGDLIESSADSLTRLRGSSNTNIELSVNVPEQPDTMRPVKALPAHKSEHQSRNRKDPSFVTAFNQQLKVLPPLAQHEWIDHQAATSQSSRGQMALDALLAKSPPTFDSPEKQFTSTQTRLLPSPQAGDSPDPSALLVPTKGLQVHTTLKEWLEMLRTQELERFTTDSRQLLRMFDEHTQRNRDQVCTRLTSKKCRADHPYHQLVSFLAQTQI